MEVKLLRLSACRSGGGGWRNGHAAFIQQYEMRKKIKSIINNQSNQVVQDNNNKKEINQSISEKKENVEMTSTGFVNGRRIEEGYQDEKSAGRQ